MHDYECGSYVRNHHGYGKDEVRSQPLVQIPQMALRLHGRSYAVFDWLQCQHDQLLRHHSRRVHCRHCQRFSGFVCDRLTRRVPLQGVLSKQGSHEVDRGHGRIPRHA